MKESNKVGEKKETYDNKALDLLLGNFDLHGLVLSEFKQSVEEDAAGLALNNFSVLSPSDDLTALLDDPFNDRVELVQDVVDPLLILSNLEMLQWPDEVSEAVFAKDLKNLASDVSDLLSLAEHHHGDGAVGPFQKLLGQVKGLLCLCALGHNPKELADLLGPQRPQLVYSGGVEKVVHDELPHELPVRSEGNHGH